MIKFENGIGQIEGRVPLILHETKEILRSVRKMLEENMSKKMQTNGSIRLFAGQQ